ncbi:MAG: DUF2975 domain-containing protein [Arcticibacter sp.]
MKKNPLLNVAMFTCKVFCFMQLAMLLLITVVLVHWHVNREFYSEMVLTSGFLSKSTIGYSVTTRWTTETLKAPLTLSNVKPASLYFSYIQIAMILLFTFLAFKEFLKVIRSVRLIQTFKKANIKSFRSIGKYFLLIFILTSFSVVYFEQGMFYGVSLSVTPLILMFVAYILAEIFKEGNDLSEENQLTI